MHTNLKLFRIKRGMTQEAFAEAVGYNRCHYGRIEGGKCKVPMTLLERIRERFNISGDELLELAKKDGE